MYRQRCGGSSPFDGTKTFSLSLRFFPAPFCVRVDTSKRHVGGNLRHEGETDCWLCPWHEAPFPVNGSSEDGMDRKIYFGLAFLMSFMLAKVITSIPFALVASPTCWIVARLSRRAPLRS